MNVKENDSIPININKTNMSINVNSLKNVLESKGVKPSYQRLRILEYIIKKDIHPSVDTIYKALHKKIPTLSKTTVYNTLSLFEKKKIVNCVTIFDNELRYDFKKKPHAHFLCIECGEVYDIHLDTDTDTYTDRNSDLFNEDFIKGYKTTETHIHFKGICKKCLKK